MTTLTKTAVLPCTVDEAFALVTQPERLRRWQAVTARVDLRVGGDYRWTVTPGHIVAGTVKELEPGKRIVLGWGWEGSDDLPLDSSIVTVTVTPVEGGTEVTLVHEGLSPEQAVGHEEGWAHFLGRLEQLATTGDAGQDEWAWAPESLDALTAAEAALAVLQPVLRRLTEEHLAKPTPCADFDVRALVEHLAGSMVGVGGMSGGTVTDISTGSVEERLSDLAAQAIEAWRARGLDGTIPSPRGGEMPAALAAVILSVELLVHAWDLAEASGQQVRVSDEVVSWVRDHATPLIDGGRGGAFAPEVEAPEDADALSRLAAYAGRASVAA
ncbi:TIGR03086 family protein [Nocardioides gansuensis]|uniref:TIGR03086 family protein n=1 Tax=Nocardioides gansuensis TaxID=2138300 RepID=A0A2T8F6C6_9ACTN|nr:TIGR03086 family metal-binding protein [Nocardioides gansuensis]PVG81266.1 TIGR03086 family protein [Nocardioides gansuensis]